MGAAELLPSREIPVHFRSLHLKLLPCHAGCYRETNRIENCDLVLS